MKNIYQISLDAQVLSFNCLSDNNEQIIVVVQISRTKDNKTKCVINRAFDTDFTVYNMDGFVSPTDATTLLLYYLKEKNYKLINNLKN